MSQTILNTARALTYDERRTLAFLLLAEQRGCRVTCEYEHMPDAPDKKYESLRVRASIRAKYAGENDTKFQEQLDAMLAQIDTQRLDLYTTDLVEWMRANIQFVEVDDPLFLERWLVTKVAQQRAMPL